MATVSSHILDSILGCSAAGIRVELYRLSAEGNKDQLFDVVADGEGRIAESVSIESRHAGAEYELVFHSADYFDTHPVTSGALNEIRQPLRVVVVRMEMPDPETRYHIPLVLAPHSYTIWWSG